ncbi:unnamed protein product, partial [Didymodactylos carnosus]
MQSSTRPKSSPLDRPLTQKPKGDINLSTFALLFSEMVQYSQNRVDSINDLQNKLSDFGKHVGIRVLDLFFLRERKDKREIRLTEMLVFIKKNIWKFLFNREAENLEQHAQDINTYYIIEKECLVNKFISIPKDKGSLTCAAFVAGIVEGILCSSGFLSKVAAHQGPRGTAYRNPKFELKKDELVRLLGRFEAELQAKEIALATMKSEKVKTLLYNARFGRLNCNSDPYSALLRDSETIKEDLLGEQIPMKTVYESQLSQLEHLIVQQKKQVQLLKNVLNESDKKLITLMEELESEKHHKTRVQTLQNQLLESQKEKLQLKNDLDNVHFHNKELEQQLVQLLHLLEQEQQRHKQFVVILINERKQLFSHLKSEKEKYKQQIDKILGDSTQDKDVQQQYERKYKQLEDEYEQCKDKLNTKIKQLQMELELVNEKYQQQQLTQPLPVVHQHANVMEQDMNEADTKQTIHVKDLKSHSHQGVKRLESAPPTNVSHIMSEHPNVTITSSTTISTTSDTKSPLPTNSNIRRPAIIPSPRTMQVTSVTTKISSPRLQTPSSPSIPSVSVSTTSSPSSIIEIAPTTTTAIIKRSVIPAIQSRNVNSTESAPLMMSNLRSPSTSHNVQNSSITPTTISSPSSRSIPKLTKNSLVSASNINKPTKMSVHQEHDSTAASVTKRMQLSNNHDLRSSSGVIDDLQNLLNVIHSAVENRLNTEIYPADSHITREYPYKTTTNTSEESTNEQEENVSSFPINQLTVLLRAAQMGEADQLIKLLNLGLNPKNSSPDGTTALHLACLFGHNDCIRHLIFHGADPFIENVLGQTPFKNLTKLDETNELECLKTLVEDGKYPPPTDLLNDCIVNNHQQTFDYLFSLSAETILNDEAILCKVLRTTLRSSNTHFLESLFTIVSVKDFVHFVDATCFITNECLSLLSSLNINNNPINTKPIELAVYLSSSLSATSLSASRERSFSYGIGVIQLTYDMSWLEFEKTIIKVYNEHLAQVDSPFDYTKCTIGITTKSIDVLCLGQYKWLYQDSPDDLNLPYVIVHEQSLQTVNICLKGIESNSTDALAYNYFIPSQNLKNFLRYIEQNTYVGVYGAPHTNKHTLFEGLIRQFEHSPLPSSTPKFKVIRF